MRLASAAAPLSLLFSVAVWPAGPVDAAEGDLWAIDRENVNVRAGPSTSTEILMTINPGERIVEIASKGEWYFVEFPDHDKRGWVFGPLLTAPDAASTAAATPTPAPVTPAARPEPATTETAAPQIETPSAASSENRATAVAASTPALADAPDAAASPNAAASAAPQDDAATATATATAALSIDDEPAAVKSFRDTVSELNERAVSVAGINLFNDVRSTGGGGVQVLATETWASVPEAGQSSYMNALFDRWQSVANGLGPLSLQIVDPNGEVMMERTGS